MWNGMATFAGEDGESHAVVASAAMLATHDGLHADLVAAFTLDERLRVTIGAIKPCCMLGVRELDPGHFSRFSHDDVVKAAFRGAFARERRTRSDKALFQRANPVDPALSIRWKPFHGMAR